MLSCRMIAIASDSVTYDMVHYTFSHVHAPVSTVFGTLQSSEFTGAFSLVRWPRQERRVALPLYGATSGAVPAHCIRLFPPPGCGNNGFVRTWNPFSHSRQKQKPDISPTLHASAAKLMLHRVFFALRSWQQTGVISSGAA